MAGRYYFGWSGISPGSDVDRTAADYTNFVYLWSSYLSPVYSLVPIHLSFPLTISTFNRWYREMRRPQTCVLAAPRRCGIYVEKRERQERSKAILETQIYTNNYSSSLDKQICPFYKIIITRCVHFLKNYSIFKRND